MQFIDHRSDWRRVLSEFDLPTLSEESPKSGSEPLRPVILDGRCLTIEQVVAVAYAKPGTVQVSIADEAKLRVQQSRRAVERFVERGEIVYGITTGFGAFCDRFIDPEQTATLQRNIIMSHAVGVGSPFESPVVRAMMLIRANTLAKGLSGIRLEVLEFLITLLNKHVHPIIPRQGSLGASGDLAPLAHMSLIVMGLGHAEVPDALIRKAWADPANSSPVYSSPVHGKKGVRIVDGNVALRAAGLSPMVLLAKEGLALTNGTALMAALGCLLVVEAENAGTVADIAAALSVEALHGTPAAYDERIHAARPHPQQIRCAAHMRKLLEGSTFVRRPSSRAEKFLASDGIAEGEHSPLIFPSTDDADKNVAGDVEPEQALLSTKEPLDTGKNSQCVVVEVPQDAYTLRCVPQVHGACHDAIAYTRWVVEFELNSASDNPLIFIDPQTEEADVVSGGNFHGEPLALAFDFVCTALTELGNISERRLARLTDNSSNRSVLPAFLTKHGGLESGLMIVQYTAASLCSENKSLTHPASADTIPTSANWEDHVSNGPIAARQARRVLRNVEYILAMELFAAAQGIDFRRETMTKEGFTPQHGTGTGPVYAEIRRRVPFIEHDTIVYPYMETIRSLVASGCIRRMATQTLGEIYHEGFDRISRSVPSDGGAFRVESLEQMHFAQQADRICRKCDLRYASYGGMVSYLQYPYITRECLLDGGQHDWKELNTPSP